jgi:hypothetical protein
MGIIMAIHNFLVFRQSGEIQPDTGNYSANIVIWGSPTGKILVSSGGACNLLDEQTSTFNNKYDPV